MLRRFHPRISFVDICALGALSMVILSTQAHATPMLQLYIEGATYNPVTESWEATPPNSSSGAPFQLWAIGNVGGPGGKGSIFDVRLSVAYDAVKVAPTILLTPGTTGGFGGFTDPSIPTGTGTLLQTVTDGSVPILGNGKPLPSHGIFGSGTHWQEFSLGDFTLSDSPIGDFIGAFPTETTPNSAQINVYDVSVLGGSGLTVHFDLYDTIASANHARFAPFSHDADAEANIIPEPASVVLFGTGALSALALKRRRRKKTV